MAGLNGRSETHRRAGYACSLFTESWVLLRVCWNDGSIFMGREDHGVVDDFQGVGPSSVPLPLYVLTALSVRRRFWFPCPDWAGLLACTHQQDTTERTLGVLRPRPSEDRQLPLPLRSQPSSCKRTGCGWWQTPPGRPDTILDVSLQLSLLAGSGRLIEPRSYCQRSHLPEP